MVEVELVDEAEVVKDLDEVFDFFPFWPLDLEEVVVDTDVEIVIVTVGASVMVMVTVPEPLSSPEGEAVGRLLSSEVLLVLSSTLEVEAVGLPLSSEVLLGLSSSRERDELEPEVGSSLPLSGWAARLAMRVAVALALSSVAVDELSSVDASVLASVMTGKELSSVMVADALSSVAVGVAESSVVRVTPVTKPEPVGK